MDPYSENIIFYFTCFIVLVKLAMLIFMLVKIHHRKKEGLQLAVTFLRSMWFLVFTLLLSRLFYMWFDFGLTHFDEEVYFQYVIWWKIAQFIVGIGLAVIVFVVDRNILQFKFKGIFAYIIIAGLFIMLFWPVYSKTDFDSMSIMSILPQLGMLIVFFVFLNIAIKATGRVRTTAVIIIWAFVLYTVAALSVNAGIISAIEPILGSNTKIYMYAIQTLLKTAGIIMMASGASRWGN